MACQPRQSAVFGVEHHPLIPFSKPLVARCCVLPGVFAVPAGWPCPGPRAAAGSALCFLQIFVFGGTTYGCKSDPLGSE